MVKAQKFVDYGPLYELVGRGRKKKEQGYRRYVESGMVENDEELQEAMELSSKAIGLEPFCRWVEEELRELTGKQGRAEDVAMRRVEVGLEPARVLEVVEEVFEVDRPMLLA